MSCRSLPALMARRCFSSYRWIWARTAELHANVNVEQFRCSVDDFQHICSLSDLNGSRNISDIKGVGSWTFFYDFLLQQIMLQTTQIWFFLNASSQKFWEPLKKKCIFEDLMGRGLKFNFLALYGALCWFHVPCAGKTFCKQILLLTLSEAGETAWQGVCWEALDAHLNLPQDFVGSQKNFILVKCTGCRHIFLCVYFFPQIKYRVATMTNSKNKFFFRCTLYRQRSCFFFQHCESVVRQCVPSSMQAAAWLNKTRDTRVCDCVYMCGRGPRSGMTRFWALLERETCGAMCGIRDGGGSRGSGNFVWRHLWTPPWASSRGCQKIRRGVVMFCFVLCLDT